MDTLENSKPKNVRELIKLVQNQVDNSFEDIEREVKSLHKKGLVIIEEAKYTKQKFSEFLSPRNNSWFWIIIITSILSFLSIIFLPEKGNPLSYVRYLLAFILVAFLPGYTLTQTLFPKDNGLDLIERFTFSIGLSFAMTAIVALFLSFTPLGITLLTALLGLGSLVIILAIVGLFRKYRLQ